MKSLVAIVLLLVACSAAAKDPYSPTGLKGTFDEMVDKAKHHTTINNDIESVSESACHLECNNHIGDDNDILMKIKCNQCCAKSCLRTRMAVSACVCRSCIEYTTTCPTDEPTSSPVVSAPSDDSGGDTNRSNSDTADSSAFGTQLFKTVADNFPEGNVLISPLSVQKALDMVKDGATEGSDNEAEMEQVLGSRSLIEQTENEGSDDPDVMLSIANSVWADNLKDSFIETVQDEHDAAAFPMPSRYSTVDSWIEENTNGMIKDMLGDDKIPSDIVALLVNAVYFKGAWKYKFDKDKTVDGEFTSFDGSKTPARMMSNTFTMGLIHPKEELGGASAISLDYGKSDDDDDTPSEFTSLFFLPATNDAESMNDLITGLTKQPLSELLDNAWSRNVNLKLPRFKLNWGSESLKETLQTMGMIEAFECCGNFLRMTGDDAVALDDVLHSTAMEVTEEGTEAAAATVAKMSRRSVQRAPPELIFDRPFVVAIIHRPTGEPIFLGRVEEPELDFD